ncbi:NEW3 domain-containing protein [Virgibacillus ndiopensis]|uniref:COG1470 family protein n=1 Tax=Virgibacillus ndiopensis TaxID=2004408 RepID=UPI003183642F
MPSFRNVESQHGHHRAITILTKQAFEDAANPTVFPEQLENGLSVWQIKKLYLTADEENATTSIEIGDYDPIYGMTYPQLGEKSRYLHKSQGMGNDIPAEPRQFQLELINSIETANNPELFAGVPYDFSEWADNVSNKALQVQLKRLQQDLEQIIELYPNREAILPASQQALKNVQRIVKKIEETQMDASIKNDLLHKLELKEEQLNQLSFVSSSLNVKTSIDSQVLTQGEKTKVTMTISNESNTKIKNINASLLTPENWEFNQVNQIKHLKPNESKTITFNFNVPDNAEYYHSYEEPILQGYISFKEKGMLASSIVKFDNTIAVLPDLSVKPNPENIMINTADIKNEEPVTIKVKNYINGNKDATVLLKLPEGWTSEPEQENISFTKRFEEKEVTFKVNPPNNIEKGNFSIEAIAKTDGEKFNTTVQEIKYDHIKDSYYQYPSAINGVAFQLLKPDNLKIGYIESGFDKVADHLINAGFNINKLTEADLSSGDLSQFDTIITGIRANLSREDLVQNNDRLLKYVENGGHLVVQYHKPWDNWNIEQTPPYQLEIGQPSIEWRVTDENAEVTMTQPDHKLFNYPNKITNKDWDNWAQERGLYFPMNWDDRYETFVSMADPNEEPFTGGILLAEYGEGTYIYSSLVFYRQIENQVPGGYRIFTNLISYGATQ